MMPTAMLFFALLPWFSLIEGKSLEADEPCVGMQRGDRSYDFDLPDSVKLHMHNDTCDAEWTIDESFTAVLDRNLIYFSHPFKEVTWHGISVKYCPVSVRFHVSCPIYTRELTCSCTNSTDNNPFLTTSVPSRDIMFSGSTKRHHYCTIAVAATFVIILVILAFFISRTNSTAKYAPKASADEQNHPGSEELT